MTDFKVSSPKEGDVLMLHCYFPLDLRKMQDLFHMPLITVERQYLLFIYDNG